jgi:hypothetical protein
VAVRDALSETTYFPDAGAGLFRGAAFVRKVRTIEPTESSMSIHRMIFVPLAAVLVAAFPAQATDTSFAATLTGEANVPEPIDTPATGELKLIVAPDGRSVHYVLTVKNITNAADGDLHLGPAGANGPLVVKLFPIHGAKAKKGPYSGVLAEGSFDGSDLIGPLTGAGLDELLDQIRSGNAYVNVHTNDGMDPPNSGPGDYHLGEIRGQIK